LRAKPQTKEPKQGFCHPQTSGFAPIWRPGCANAQKEIAGRVISGQPYFQFADAFQQGEDIYASLDPAALDPAVIGRKFALYVMDHKDAAGWSANNSLTNLPELGGNP